MCTCWEGFGRTARHAQWARARSVRPSTWLLSWCLVSGDDARQRAHRPRTVSMYAVLGRSKLRTNGRRRKRAVVRAPSSKMAVGLYLFMWLRLLTLAWVSMVLDTYACVTQTRLSSLAHSDTHVQMTVCMLDIISLERSVIARQAWTRSRRSVSRLKPRASS